MASKNYLRPILDLVTLANFLQFVSRGNCKKLCKKNLPSVTGAFRNSTIFKMIVRKSVKNHYRYLLLLSLFITADVFISMEKDAEASACVQEAHLIFPMSPDVLFQVCCYLS